MKSKEKEDFIQKGDIIIGLSLFIGTSILTLGLITYAVVEFII